MLLPITSFCRRSRADHARRHYLRAQYGGSTTSVLVNIPGEAARSSHALTAIRWPARAGPGGAVNRRALLVFCRCVSTILVAALGVPLTALALLFGPAEYFSLMVLGLIFAVVLAKGSVLNAIAMIVSGLLLSMVGSVSNTGAAHDLRHHRVVGRHCFANGAMGMFGFAGSSAISKSRPKPQDPRRQDHRLDADPEGPVLISGVRSGDGTILGSLLGILPVGGAVVASFAAIRSKRGCRSIRNALATAPSRVSPPLRAPTMRPPRPHSFRC